MQLLIMFEINCDCDLIFDSSKLREHLITCLENETITGFPTATKTICGRRKKTENIYQ